MSDKVRRQKDIITNSIESYKSATKAYSDYFDGTSPVTIIYYQINNEATRTDSALYDTHEVVGQNSSIRYNRIKNVPVYGINTLSISNSLSGSGYESTITGEFVMVPDLTINPKIGEFFAIYDSSTPELATHLFQITDVQYDRATSQKFYQCQFKLYNKDTDELDPGYVYDEENHPDSQIMKHYVYDASGSGNENGVGDSVLITEEEAADKAKLSNMADALIDKFEELFYNEGMDTFTYQKPLDSNGEEFEYYWSPYICHFIYKNDVLEKSDRDFLTEIFVQDVNEREFPGVYSERGYRKSIFYAVEMDDCKTMDDSAGFMEISPYLLNKPLNLPFFSSGDTYKLLDVQHPVGKCQTNPSFWLGAFNWMYDDEDRPFQGIPDEFFFVGDFERHLTETLKVIDDAGEANPGFSLKLKDGTVLTAEDMLTNQQYYQVSELSSIKDGSKIKTVWRIPGASEDDDESVPYVADLKSFISDEGHDEFSDAGLLLNIVKGYFNKTLTVSDDLLSELNEYYYANDVRTYILLPIVIYILQNYGAE